MDRKKAFLACIVVLAMMHVVDAQEDSKLMRLIHQHKYAPTDYYPQQVNSTFPTMTQLWNYTREDSWEAIASIPDIDGDGKWDAVGAMGYLFDKGMFMISGASSGNPTPLWWHENCIPNDNFNLSIIPDLNENGSYDILMANVGGTQGAGRSVYAFDGYSGNEIFVWHGYDEPTSSWLHQISPIEDVNGDGVMDILVGGGGNSDHTGFKSVFCFSGAARGDGEMIWRYRVADGIWPVIPIPDVDEDGISDVVAGSAGNHYDLRIYCISGASSGEVSEAIWIYDADADSMWLDNIKDVNGSGYDDVVAALWGDSSEFHGMVCLEGSSGEVIWRIQYHTICMVCVTVPDVDGDGFEDVCFGSWDNEVVCISGYDGSEIWTTETGTTNGGDVWTMALLEDVNGNCVKDLLIGSFDLYAYVLDTSDGSIITRRLVNSRVFSVAPIPDLDDDGRMDALVGTQDGDFMALSTAVGVPDTFPPYMDNQVPAPGASDVPPDNDIQLEILDCGAGVNQPSIGITVDGITYSDTEHSENLTIFEVDKGYHCTIDPIYNFSSYDVITVEVSAADLAAFPNSFSGSYTFTSADNPDAPSSAINDPLPGAVLSGENYTIRGTALDNSGSGIDRVEISTDAGMTWEVANGKHNWYYEWELPETGSYTLISRALDNDSNREAIGQGIAVTVDNLPPWSNIDNLLPGAILTQSPIPLSFSAGDEGSGVHLVHFSDDNGRTWYQAEHSKVADSNWSYTWNPVADGHYTVSSRATDLGGNIEEELDWLEVIVDGNPPESIITNLTDGQILYDMQFTMQIQALDDGSGVQEVKVTTDGGTTWNNATRTKGWSYYWSIPEYGIYTVASRAWDFAGFVETPVYKSITVSSREKPSIHVGGYFDTYIDESGGHLNLSIYSPDQNIKSVEILIFGTSTGVFLTPNGDLYSLIIPVGAGAPSGQYLLEVLAINTYDVGSDLWPYLNCGE